MYGTYVSSEVCHVWHLCLSKVCHSVIFSLWQYVRTDSVVTYLLTYSLCTKGYYNERSAANNTVECALCPAGSSCVEAGTSLASLPLKVSRQ